MVTPLKLLFTLIFILLAVLLIFVVVGCNTVHGFGTDMKEAGHEIEKGTR